MPSHGSGLRPDIETFECAGCRVTLVGLAEILALAAAERAELLHDATFPTPVRHVGLAVTAGLQDDQRVYLLDATISTGVGGSGPRPAFAVLGNDPLGVLLARRAAGGDDWATRIVDG